MNKLHSYYLFVLIIALFVRVHTQTYGIKVLTNPHMCYGGEVCQIQPVVAVYYRRSNQIAYTFTGSVYAQLGNSPSGFEKLYVGESCNLNGCGTKVTGTLAKVPFVNGIGSFESLYFLKAGTNYSIKFIGLDMNDHPFAMAFSDQFFVSVGPPFKLALKSFVGTAFGGEPFSSNPIVAVCDRGNNILPTYNNGSISASLITIPDAVSQTALQPINSSTAHIINGLATFRGLYINEAGYPYQIQFSFSGGAFPFPSIISRKFDVAVGKSVAVGYFSNSTSISASTIYAGEYIANSPILKLLDSGGNFVSSDNSTAIKIAIQANPTNATIGPEQYTFVVAHRGVVRFHGIKINKPGLNYTLRFDIFNYSSATSKFYSTGNFFLTEQFVVHLGIPRKLELAQPAANAWAGNQPFATQPILILTDYAGNRILDDSVSTATITMVESLSTHSEIVIDTTNAPVSSFASMDIISSQDIVGAGQIVDFVIDCSYHMWVNVTEDTLSDVYLRLGVISKDGNHAKAILMEPNQATTSLWFRYIVADGDTLPSGKSLVQPNALEICHTCVIYDGNFNHLNLTLPVHTIQSNIIVDTALPKIIRMYSNTTSGMYGAGEAIEFILELNQPVEVMGRPVLFLSLQNNDTKSRVNGTERAYFDYQSHNFTLLHFVYHVIPNDNTLLGGNITLLYPLIMAPNITWNETIITLDYNDSYVYSYRQMTAVDSWIKRLSTYPTTHINYSIPYDVANMFLGEFSIQINAKRPHIDANYGLRTNISPGRYYPGEKISLFVRFNQPIVVYGVGIVLHLQVYDGSSSVVASEVPNGIAYVTQLLFDNQTIQFDYVVENYCSIAHLDIVKGGNSLRIISNDSFIRQQSTNPILPCDLSTAGITGLHNPFEDGNITLYGFPPTVTNVTLVNVEINSVHPSRQHGFVYPDDIIYIAINFSEPVVASCLPVFSLQMNFEREATYFSGNNSNQILFQYIIAFGDETVGSFGYKTIPNALCSSSGCPQSTKTQCQIYATSIKPTMPVDLRLSHLSHHQLSSIDRIVPLGNYSISSVSLVRKTTVSKITCRQSGGTYGVGSIFYFDVWFSDVVIVRTLSSFQLPSLWLTTNTSASYFSGNYERVVTFSYVMTENDTLVDTQLVPKEFSNAHTIFPCSILSHCSITNEAGMEIDYSLNQANISSIKGIYLDPTPPTISSILVIPRYSQNYTAGQAITIQIIPSAPVVVGGVAPRIKLKLPNTEAYAVYNASSSTSSALNFVYLFQLGDMTNNLSFVGNRIDLFDGFSQILRESSIPTTQMNVSFPSSLTYHVSSNKLHLDTIEVPQVLQVRCLNSGSNFSAGDKLFFQIEFSLDVIVCGHLMLGINTGNRISYASYIGFKRLNYSSSGVVWEEANFLLPSPYTRYLIFEYSIQEGDFSLNLEYADCSSLLLGKTENHDISYIKRFIATDGVEADITLPLPGEINAISGDGVTRYVDGRVPYLQEMKFSTVSGVYSVNESIYLHLKFSAPVVVLNGVPSIVLESGVLKNEAIYVNGSGTNILSFQYIPEPGDQSDDLDYYSSRINFGYSNNAFRYNGAEVLLASTFPFVSAHIIVNPAKGQIRGESTMQAVEGTFLFADSHVSYRGLDYEILYEVSVPYLGVSFVAFQLLPVSFSSEWELRPDAAWKEEMIGYAVDIHDDIAVIGAPNFNVSVTTIQVVTISVEKGIPQREIQAITTSIIPRPAIQRFFTIADANETIEGYFTITIGEHGTTRPLAANIDAASLVNFLDFDLEGVGRMNATIEPFHSCRCQNARVFTLTFEDITTGVFDAIIVDDSMLIGHGAMTSDIEILQTPSLLQGTFNLTAFNKTSNPILIDATVAEITDAIQSLGLSVFSVTITMETNSLTRTWSVEFNEYNHSYEIPLLGVASEEFYGGNDPNVFVTITQPGRHGPNGIAGHFQLSWRGNTTIPLSPFTTATEMKAVLEDLPIINTVNVNRTLSSSDVNAYSWTIEFVSVNYHNSRGYFVETKQSNIEPITSINHLIASGVNISVDAKWELGSRNEVYSGARRGTFGEGAGAVFVYQRKNESWVEVVTLRGNDTVEANKFGSSVSIDNDAILIGAIGANVDGVPEKQEIYCMATSGGFRLSFRGWSTDYISFNITKQNFIDIIVSSSDIFKNLYSIRAVQIDGWKNGGGLCNNNTAEITFYSPVYSAPNVDDSNSGSNLELLTIYSSNLTNGIFSPTLNISEKQRGTWILQGSNSDPQQRGAAYVFRYQNNCNQFNRTFCLKKEWKQEAQFFPTGYIPETRFGERVLLSDNVAIVGATEYSLEVGALYIFEYDTSIKVWSFLQRLDDPTPIPGNHFGRGFGKFGNTLAVGSPNFQDNIGFVYIYTRPYTGASFTVAQLLVPSDLPTGSMYGTSISMYQNWIVIGAPGFDSNSIYLGPNPPVEKRTEAGAVYVFRRNSANTNYIYSQMLNPTNIKDYDHFGRNVKIENGIVLVSAVADFDETLLLPSKVIMQIQTQAAYDHTSIGGFFRILWKFTNISSPDSSFAFKTRLIRYDTTALQLKHILEEDLHTGDIIVSRSRVDMFDGGYAWQVTFMRQRNDVNIFEVDTSFLTGTNATVNITYITTNPPKLRNKVHLFQLQPVSNQFVEELFLTPSMYQRVDRCGWSIGLSGSYAIVGCPNRDRDIPLQNSGAAYVYDLILLNLRYSLNSQSETVVEGSRGTVSVSFDESSPLVSNHRDVYFYLQTLDRNSNTSLQNFFGDLYGLNEAQLHYSETFLDHIQIVGNATARSQYYGSDQRFSRWVDGRYDYRAISDYVQTKSQFALLSEADSIQMLIDTNPDTLIEFPFESIKSVIHIPGLWPSVLSKFYFTTVVEDNWSGYPLNHSHYTKFANSSSLIGEQNGQSVVVKESFGILFLGAPLAAYNNVNHAGRVLQYGNYNNTWIQKDILESPTVDTDSVGGKFGSALAFDYSAKRKMAIVVIGEPEAAKVHVFWAVQQNYNRKVFVYDTTLTTQEATLSAHHYGDTNAIGINGHIVAVGAAGLEAVFIFRHIFNSATNKWFWSSPETIRSSDYDYDFMNHIVFSHRQYFGRSVSVSERSIVIGAPYGDYANSGSNLTETYNTEGMNIFSVGKGRSYVFYSQPASSAVCLTSSQPLKEGSFVLDYDHYGTISTTIPIRFNGSDTDLLEALKFMENVDEISIVKMSNYTISGQGDFSYCWTVVWNAEWSDIGSLTARWHNHSCSNCKTFDYPMANHTANITTQVEIKLLQTMRPITQVAVLSAPDRRQGDRFGYSVDISGDYVVVGAPYSAGGVSTTWDFEVGTLDGWSKTGDAFDFQPTFGDNSKFRLNSQIQSHMLKHYNNFRGTSSKMKGRYYVSTYDRHPGDSYDFSIPDPSFPFGGLQGNAPKGTLTSDVFLILGNRISFLIGGGCDINSVYVELVVDGKSVGKQTGQCSDVMNLVKFIVTPLRNRAAVLRVVDNSTTSFIAIDHIEFDWNINGARKAVDSNNAVLTVGNFETLYSGAAYLFKRTNVGGNNFPCMLAAEENCTWRFQSKFLPSDKRENSLFGSYVAVNGKNGIVAVGAPKAELTGNYKDTYTTYPYMKTDGSSTAGGLQFPVNPNRQTLFQGFPKNSLESSASFGVNILMNIDEIHSDLLVSQSAGAVYFYRKQFPIWSYNQEIGANESWSSFEVAKLQGIDSRAEDYFGQSICLDGHTIIVGATGVDVVGVNSGAGYYFNVQFMAVKFSQSVFRGIEGSEAYITFTVLRDINIYSGDLTLEFATSDITAKGIDSTHYQFCMNRTASERNKLGCGDYEQTAGIITFPAGIISSGFTVNIIDDNCYERDMKFVQLSLSVPGGSPLQGEGFEAMIRIDDDDFSKDPAMFCG